MGETPVEIQETLHRIRVSYRSKPESSRVQGQRGKTSTAGGTFHATVTERYDLHARGQQDLLRRSRKF